MNDTGPCPCGNSRFLRQGKSPRSGDRLDLQYSVPLSVDPLASLQSSKRKSAVVPRGAGWGREEWDEADRSPTAQDGRLVQDRRRGLRSVL
jgi:hypothetical protein